MEKLRITKVSINDLLRHQESNLHHASAKLTHVGEQTRPVSSVLMNVFYYLPEVDAFQELHTPGVSYVNDQLPAIFNFSVTPAEFRSMVAAVGQVGGAMGQRETAPSLSVAMIVFLTGKAEGAELLFSREGGVALHKALSGVLSPTNGIGDMVLSLQRAAAYAG